MNPLPLFLIIVTLPLLLGGCGDKPNLYYEIEGDTVTITYDFSFKKPSGKLVIPATIEGKTVTSIGYMAFAGCTSLTSITIPDGVTSIDRAAFWHCASLTSIKIPDSVTSIGGRAFHECKNLTSITIPDSVTSIGRSAFIGCTSLTTIEVSARNADYTIVNGVLFNKEKTVLHTYPAGKTGDKYNIPERVTYIEESAFYGCTSLTSITIPEGVTSIGHETFYGCTSLTSITIPDSVTSIETDAFNKCTSLTAIEVSAGNADYTIVNGVLFNKEKTVLHTYPAGKTGDKYNIPERVTYIEESAFYGCTSLTSITIPEGVTSIGDETFYGCISLTSITIPDIVTSIGSAAFKECTSLASITIPETVSYISFWAFLGCTSLKNVTFLGDAPEIAVSVFDRGATIYRKPEAKGWGDTFGGRPVKLISEKP